MLLHTIGEISYSLLTETLSINTGKAYSKLRKRFIERGQNHRTAAQRSLYAFELIGFD